MRLMATVPSEHLVVREVDDAGAAAADLPVEGVPACDHACPFRWTALHASRGRRALLTPVRT